MTVKGNSTRSWEWRREKRVGILPKNSILDVEEYEGDGGGTLGNKRSVVTKES